MFNLKYNEDYLEQQTPGEGWRTQHPKRCYNTNKEKNIIPSVNIMINIHFVYSCEEDGSNQQTLLCKFLMELEH